MVLLEQLARTAPEGKMEQIGKMYRQQMMLIHVKMLFFVKVTIL